MLKNKPQNIWHIILITVIINMHTSWRRFIWLTHVSLYEETSKYQISHINKHFASQPSQFFPKGSDYPILLMEIFCCTLKRQIVKTVVVMI